MTSTKTRVNKIATVVVPVSDQEAAVEFYVEKLGFEKRIDVPFDEGYHWIEVALGDEVTTIAHPFRTAAEISARGDLLESGAVRMDDINIGQLMPLPASVAEWEWIAAAG